MTDWEAKYYNLLREVEAVVLERNGGDFSPILPKLKRIVNDGFNESVFPIT
jgi:hypothetical protein